VRLHTTLHRSAPVYVDTAQGTISLVEEVSVRTFSAEGAYVGVRATDVKPSTLFVIDETGVHKHRFPNTARRVLLGMAAAALVGPVQYLLLAERNKKHGR
jgi:hypothetical protein